MPEMSPEHLLGDIGLHEVSSLWTRAGCRVERVQVDYGEDLSVQTQVGGEVEPFRIWVQVKTVAKLKKTGAGRFSIRIPIGHLLKWARTVDPVFVCAFDEATHRAYIVDPSEQFSLWELISASMKSKRTVAIRFSSEDLFTAKKVDLFLWKARINYYSAVIAMIDSERPPQFDPSTLDTFPRKEAEALRKADRRLETEKMASTYLFLNTVELFDGERGLADRFKTMLQNAVAYFCSNPSDDADCLEGAISFCVFGFISDVSGNVGLRGNLWSASANAVWLYLQREKRLLRRLQQIRKGVSRVSTKASDPPNPKARQISSDEGVDDILKPRQRRTARSAEKRT